VAPRRNGEPQTHPNPNQEERAEQAYEVVRLKCREGKTFAEIGEKLDMGAATAHKLFKIGLKLMAPADVKTEIATIRLQLEGLFSDIMTELDRTSEPKEKASLLAQAHANIEARRKLYGGADMVIKHEGNLRVDADLEEVHKAFEEDQEIRTQARARRWNARV
jgi:hypothetical protein